MANETESFELAESYVPARDIKEAEAERANFLTWFYKKYGGSSANRYIVDSRGIGTISSKSTEECYEYPPEEENEHILSEVLEEEENCQLEEEEDDEEEEEEEEEEEGEEEEGGEDAVNEIEYARLNDLGILNCDGWLKLSTDKYPWQEQQNTYPAPLRFEEIKLTEEEKGGKLTVPIMAAGLSNLSLVPGTVFYALTKLQLPNKNLVDITLLSNYPFLQYIDISYNKISDLTPLSHVSYLMVLDASNNNLKKFNGYRAPWFLTYLNLSWNCLTEMPDLTEFWSLRHVNISHNRIKVISGLINLKYLSYLNLSYNEIQVLENLNHLPIQELNVSRNAISSWETREGLGLRTMRKLTDLNLAFNSITSLLIIKNIYQLQILNISFNKISSMHELAHLSTLGRMRTLLLEGNKVSSLHESRRLIIYLMPTLTMLNGSPVLPAERVCAFNMYSNDIIVGTMRRMLLHSVIFGTLGPPRQGLNTMTKLYNPAMVVIVSLPGSYNTFIIAKVEKKYPSFIKVAKMHTTRPMALQGDYHRPNYLFHYVGVDEFNRMKVTGRFAAIEHRLGFKFGLCFDEIVFDGRVCLLKMELGAALELLWTGFNPTLILALPSDESSHVSRLLKVFRDDLNVIQTEGVNESKAPSVHSQQDSIDKSHFSEADITSMDNFFSDFSLGEWMHDEHENLEGDESIDEENNWFGMRFMPENYEEDLLTFAIEKSSTFCLNEKNSSSDDQESLCVKEEEQNDNQWKYHKSAELYIRSVIQLRNQYIEAHLNNPGLFMLAVSTDDLNTASLKLAAICHDVYTTISKKDKSIRMMDELKKDECYDDIVGLRQSVMMNELHAKQSTAKEQQMMSIIEPNTKRN